MNGVIEMLIIEVPRGPRSKRALPNSLDQISAFALVAGISSRSIQAVLRHRFPSFPSLVEAVVLAEDRLGPAAQGIFREAWSSTISTFSGPAVNDNEIIRLRFDITIVTDFVAKSCQVLSEFLTT